MRLAGVIFTCVLFLCGIARAEAATVVVDFESIEPGALNADSAAAQGVRFGEWYENRAVGPRWAVRNATAGAQAASGTRLAIDDFRNGGGEFQCSRTPDEPKAPAIFGRLTSLASGVSVKIGTANGGLNEGEAKLIGYDVNGDAVASAATSTVMSGQAGTPLTATTAGGAAAIAYFDVRFPDEVGATGCQDLLLDDLTITKPDTEAPGIALTYVGPDPDPNPFLKDPAVVGLRPGVTENGQVVVTKYGSVGEVSLSVAAEPATVDATVSSVPLSGRYPLSFTASPKAANERLEVVVRGTAPANRQLATAELRIPVRTARDWMLDAPQHTVVPGGCATQVPIGLVKPNTIDFPGPGDDGLLSVTAPGRPPVTATASAGSIARTDTGFTLTTPVLSGPMKVTVTAQDGSADPDTKELSLYASYPRITGVLEGAGGGRTPQLLSQGTLVQLTGEGFCPGIEIVFGAGEPSPALVAPDGKSLLVRVPRLATTGPITIAGTEVRWETAPGEAGTYVVDSFRNTQAYPFENPSLDDLEFADTVRLFGYDATHYDSFDTAGEVACEVFTLGFGDCDVEVAPATWEALVHHSIADTALSGGPTDAHCFGLAVTSQQFLRGKSRLFDYVPNATKVFDLKGPGTFHSKLRSYVRAQHGGQLSAEFINTFLGYFLNFELNTTEEVAAKLTTMMKKGIQPTIAMNQGGGGHVVVAYDIEKASGGSYFVDVWDSNIPYEGEEGDASLHEERVHSSRIFLQGNNNRWSYAPLKYGPGEYDGINHRLMIFDGGSLKKEPTLPTSFGGIYHVVFGASAKTESAKGRQSVRYSLLDAAPTSGEIFTAAKAPLTRVITPGRSGKGYLSYTAGGGMSAALKATNGSPKQTDTLTMQPRDASVRLATESKQRSFELALSANKGTDRGLLLRGSIGSGAISVDLEGSAAVIRATGPAKLTPVLTGQTKAGTAIHRVDPIKLKQGATLEIEPKGWSKVLGALKVRVRGAGPNLTRTEPALR